MASWLIIYTRKNVRNYAILSTVKFYHRELCSHCLLLFCVIMWILGYILGFRFWAILNRLDPTFRGQNLFATLFCVSLWNFVVDCNMQMSYFCICYFSNDSGLLLIISIIFVRCGIFCMGHWIFTLWSRGGLSHCNFGIFLVFRCCFLIVFW